MLLFVMQALCELAVLYPVNGAFFTYVVRFIDPSWGFACGWDYAIQWYVLLFASLGATCVPRLVSRKWRTLLIIDAACRLTILPFEITAAGLTIAYWKNAADINIGVWVTVFLVALTAIQFFGVRGYGEVEFVLSIIKIIACTGFIILAIVIDTGGVSTDDRGYIGGRYWHDPGRHISNCNPENAKSD